MLDYSEVKSFYADKLREDTEGTGRVESAFYHTMKMVYHKGVEDGRSVRPQVGIVDHGAPAFTQRWLDTDTFIDQLSPGQKRQVRALCEQFFNAGDRYRQQKGN
jgi:hypothetical protein